MPPWATSEVDAAVFAGECEEATDAVDVDNPAIAGSALAEEQEEGGVEGSIEAEEDNDHKRMESVWEMLKMPAASKMDLAIKYSSQLLSITSPL